MASPVVPVRDVVVAERYRIANAPIPFAAGVTLRARDEVLARPVAIRAVPADSAAATRLLRAASRAATVNVVGLARTYDADTTASRPASRPADRGAPQDARSDAGLDRLEGLDRDLPFGDVAFVVRRWVPGRPLNAIGPLRPEDAAGLVAAVASIVAAAGTPHGALHGGNILIADDGSLEVTDVAIAAALDGRDPTDDDDVRALGTLLLSLVADAPGMLAARLRLIGDQLARLAGPERRLAEVADTLQRVLATPNSDAPRPAHRPATASEPMTAAVEPVPTDHEVVVPASTAPLAPQPRWWRALVPMLAVAIVAGLGVLVLFSGGHLPGHTGAAGSTPSSSPSQSASRISPVAVRAFDPPPGDGHESDDKVPLATDGNPSTSWFTDGYQHRADFGGLKQGVGLLLDLGRPVSLSDVRLVVPTPGEALQLRAAVGAATAPSTAAGYSVVASVPNATATTDIRVAHRVTARYWLVWLTRLAPDGDVFRGGISEIVLSG